MEQESRLYVFSLEHLVRSYKLVAVCLTDFSRKPMYAEDRRQIIQEKGRD